MSNWGCYDLDYLLGITGWSIMPQRVLAQMWTVPPKFEALAAAGSDAETHLAATIQCGGKIAIHYERGEFVAARNEAAWQIVGSEGSLDLEMTPGSKKVVFNRASSEQGLISETLWEGDDDPAIGHKSPVLDFAAAVRGEHSPKTGLEQALVVQRITDAIYRSADTGQAVEIGK